jgi:hypothetical protein
MQNLKLPSHVKCPLYKLAIVHIQIASVSANKLSFLSLTFEEKNNLKQF